VYIYGSYRKIKTGISLFWYTLYICVIHYTPSATTATTVALKKLKYHRISLHLAAVYISIQYITLVTRSVYSTSQLLRCCDLVTEIYWTEK